MSGRFRCGGVAATPDEGRLTGPRTTVHLRPRTMEVLVVLAEWGGEVASKSALLDAVWGAASVSEAVLTNAIAELRLALAEAGGRRELVETVTRRGYRLAAAVEFEEPRPDPARSLAVLPFEDLSGDRSRQELIPNLHLALIGELVGIANLRIVPRSATAQLPPLARPLRQIGHELHTDRLLIGSLLGSGMRLRVNAQLVELAADRVVWSTSMVVPLGDPIDTPTTVARAITGELGAVLGVAARRPPESALDAPLAERFQRGQFLLRGSTVERLELGLADLAEVARLRPDLAPAHAGLARGRFLLASWCADPGGKRLGAAERAAALALELDRESVEARIWWTMARAFGHSQIAEAIDPLAGLVRDHPHNPEARDALAHCMAIVGRLPEAIAEERRALADDPLSPALRAALGFFLRAAGELEAAAEVLSEALKLHPEWTIARLELARVRWAQGQSEVAAQDLVPVDREWAEFTSALCGGEIAAARRFLDRWQAEARLAPYWLAERCLWAGETAAALSALERAFVERQLRLAYLSCDPTFAPLAPEPRFRSLLRRIGLNRQHVGRAR